MGNLGDILKNKIEQLGISKQVEAVDIVERATKIISQYVSLNDFEVISFKKGNLKVLFLNSSASSEININENIIKSKIKGVNKIIQVSYSRDSDRDHQIR